MPYLCARIDAETHERLSDHVYEQNRGKVYYSKRDRKARRVTFEQIIAAAVRSYLDAIDSAKRAA